MARNIGVMRLGLVEYVKAVSVQRKCAGSVKEGKTACNGGVLLIVEHPPTYTIGIRSNNYSIDDEKKLRRLGADFIRTNRGGLITFHGPGQLVAYPILNLKQFSLSMRHYVYSLEEVAIDLCSRYSLPAYRSPHTGVWIGDKKICAIGVHASRFVTTHGLAINCSTNLSWFDHIVPCGITGKGVTSLSSELDRLVHLQEAVPLFLDSFEKVFDCKLVDETSVL